MSVTAPNGAVTLAVGEQIGPWIIAGFLGSGGSASVYLASSSSSPDLPPTASADRHEVALRICRPSDERHLQAIVSTYGATPVHKNVATVHDVRVESINGHRHVVCIAELADGGTLAERIELGPLDPEESRVLATHLVDGLAAYHENDLVHGDVKPENVMRFGSAWKLVDPAATEVTVADPNTSAVVSHERTLRYVPPEMLDTPGRTRRTGDVWALGVTLHEAAAGESPFGSMADQVVARSSIARTVPAELAKLIKTCVAPIERRPRTADELRHLPRFARPRRAALVAAATAGVLVAVLLAVAAVRAVSGNDDALDGDADEVASSSVSVTAASSEIAPSSTLSTATSTGSSTTGQTLPAAADETLPPASATTTAPSGDPAPSTSAQGNETFSVDFEGAGDDIARFVAVDGRQSPAVVAANDGSVLEVAANNVSRRLGLLATPGGSPILGGGSVTMAADVRLAYYGSTEWGALGPAYGLVLKSLPDDGGAYVATVYPDNGAMTVRIGLIAGPGNGAGTEAYQYAGPATGHSQYGEGSLFAEPFNDRPVVTELGYWALEANLTVDGPRVLITASLISPTGERESLGLGRRRGQRLHRRWRARLVRLRALVDRKPLRQRHRRCSVSASDLQIRIDDRAFTVEAGTTFSFGRDEGLGQIGADDSTVSRVHGVVGNHPDHWEVASVGTYMGFSRARHR